MFFRFHLVGLKGTGVGLKGTGVIDPTGSTDFFVRLGLGLSPLLVTFLLLLFRFSFFATLFVVSAGSGGDGLG